MDNTSNKDWYQILIDNPDLSADELVRDIKQESFLNMMLKDDDIKILANSDINKINKELDKLDGPSEIKMLMKQLFKK
tara:strand:+ start:249 stop:482 length:234 start_codon:yes stop_codon:yes gene_type:complete